MKLKKDPISQIVFLDEAMKVSSIVDRTNALVTLVMFRRCWRISQAQPFGLHWPGPWRSRPGTGRRVRCFPKLEAALKHLFRLNVSATNIEFWLSKAIAPLPRFFLKNRSPYRHRIHARATKVCIYLMAWPAIYPEPPSVQKPFSFFGHSQPLKRSTSLARQTK